MNENDFLMDEEDPFLEMGEPMPPTPDLVDESEEANSSSDSDESTGIVSYEMELSRSYDDILKANDLTDVISIIIAANPVNSNSVIVSEKVKEFMQLQGKTRVVNNYSAGLLVATDVETEMEGDDSGELNERKEREARDLIWRFIKYLAERDLSNDNVTNRRRKLRHIPALIIYLFSNKMYGLLINCPYMPEDYQQQISNALLRLNEDKYKLVEELAKMYDDAGNPELAKRVRDMRLSFFDKEPAELRSSVEFRYMDISDADVAIYKSMRNKYVNISKSITQEVASDLIEVVIDKDAGINEKLKDKVRTESINEVKTLLREFAENSTANQDNEIASNIILNK